MTTPQTDTADKYAAIMAKEEDLLQAKVVQTMSAYNAEPTTANLRNWQSAKKALEEYRARQAEGGEKFLRAADVVRWVVKQEYRLPGKSAVVSDRSVYNHINEGKIPLAKGGGYTMKAVQDYAARYLEGGPSTSSTGSTQPADELNHHRLRSEKADADLKEIKVAIQRRDYIPAAEEERRDAAILAGIRSTFLNAGPGFVSKMKANPDATEAELLALWLDLHEEAFDTIARQGYVEVPVEDTPEE